MMCCDIIGALERTIFCRMLQQCECLLVQTSKHMILKSVLLGPNKQTCYRVCIDELIGTILNTYAYNYTIMYIVVIQVLSQIYEL